MGYGNSISSVGAALFVTIVLGACSTGIAPMATRPVTPVTHPAPQVPNGVADGASGGVTNHLPLPFPGEASSSESRMIRVALALNEPAAEVGSVDGGWAVYSPDGTLIVSGGVGEPLRIEARSGVLLVTAFGVSERLLSPIIIKPQQYGFLQFKGKRYRGDLTLGLGDGDKLHTVNTLPVEEYLRGVVPLEIGQDRRMEELAAVAAQSVAARSYAYSLMNGHPVYDIGATVMHQVYGGADVERALSDSAIAMTRGLVLMYDGKVAMTPYHSSSGGTTASANEIWKSEGLPYLISVSDRIPGTNRYYAEESPPYAWNRTYSGGGLVDILNKSMRQYVPGFKGRISRVNNIVEGPRTASGRLSSVVIDTDRGKFTVRGSDMRFVFRTTSGQILPSTLCNIKVERSGGRVARLVISGNGNGHGVGMDQWGAIYRARAGQDFLTILQTYYPGTTIGTVL